VFQYTSGTTRELPAAVKHSHRALVTLMFAALYGTGIRPGDEFFCPSSPAWATAFGMARWRAGARRHDRHVRRPLRRSAADESAPRLRDHEPVGGGYPLQDDEEFGEGRRLCFLIRKLSYTGEPIDSATLEFIDQIFHVPACSMYGTTEIGVVLVNYPGASDYVVKPGSLGKAVPGLKLQVQQPDGTPTAPGVVRELMLWRRNGWETTKDLAKIDEDGYFYHAGRADDVIISAGWTMSAVEIENTLLKHPDVREAAVIGVSDATRGQVAKAFIVSERSPSDGYVEELKIFTRMRLSQHEFPRHIEFVNELPKTPAGKVNRKVLRDREAAKAICNATLEEQKHADI